MKKIEVQNDSNGAGQVPIRRRNTSGVQTVAINITIPKELYKHITRIVNATGKSRSLVVTELIMEGVNK